MELGIIADELSWFIVCHSDVSLLMQLQMQTYHANMTVCSIMSTPD